MTVSAATGSKGKTKMLDSSRVLKIPGWTSTAEFSGAALSRSRLLSVSLLAAARRYPVYRN